MGEQERLKDCYKDMYRGMIGKNRPLLEHVLDDTFVLLHMTGMRQTKKEYIKAIEDGTLNYYSAEHQTIAVETQGFHANLVGQCQVNAAVFGGGPHIWRLQLNCQLVKEGDTWKITKAKASTY